jgi:multidrug efflux pump subunit AcrB
LKIPTVVSLSIVFGSGLTFLLWPKLGSELFPEVDSGSFGIRLKTLSVTLTKTTSFNRLTRSAAQIRLRPILMTSLTLVASMQPLSFQLSPGNEAMLPLARALLGGIVVSTVLTLFLVPRVYSLVHRNSNGRADANPS